MVHDVQHSYVCVRGGSAPLSHPELDVQFESHHNNRNDLWRLLPLATLLLRSDTWLERNSSACPSGKEERS